MLIKRGKTTQRWQFSSSQPLPMPCTSNTHFPAGVAPASPLLPTSSFQQPTAEHAGRSESGGGKTAHSASREEKGKEYPERNCLTALPFINGKKKKISRLFPPVVWAQKRPSQNRPTRRRAVGWGQALRHVFPCKVLWAPLLLPVKLQTISQPHSWQGLGPNPGARAARHCHTGEAAPRRYQDRAGGRKPRADPASGAPGSRDAAFHHETSAHSRPKPSPTATRTHVPSSSQNYLVNLVAFIFYFFFSLKLKTVSNSVPPLDSSCQFLWFCNVKKKFPLWKNPCKQ